MFMDTTYKVPSKCTRNFDQGLFTIGEVVVVEDNLPPNSSTLNSFPPNQISFVFGTSMGWFHGTRLGYVIHCDLGRGKKKGPRNVPIGWVGGGLQVGTKGS
jgi:hypothetical protein